MALKEKHKGGRRGASRLTPGRGRARGGKRIFRRRRRAALLVVCAVAVVSLAGLGAAFFLSAPETGGAPVARVDAPAVAGAPEVVSDRPARAEREAAGGGAAEEEREAAEREAAEREAAAAPDDPTLYLTVPRLGVYGHTVRNDDSEQALDLGAIKEPHTGFPWQEGDTNTYIAGHRVGWPGTESYYQFYDLPAMQAGDEVILEDANGAVYTYRVTEVFAVTPWETWVTEPVPGRDVVTLQTCTETVDDWWTIGPGLMQSWPESGRLVVRADRVA